MKKLIFLLALLLMPITCLAASYNWSNTSELNYQRNSTHWWLNSTGNWDRNKNAGGYNLTNLTFLSALSGYFNSSTVPQLSINNPNLANSGIGFYRADVARAGILWNSSGTLDITAADFTTPFMQFHSVNGLFINQNVGIGTATPATPLEVDGVSVSAASNSDIVTVLSNDSVAINKGGGIAFGGYFNATAQANWARVYGWKETATAGDRAGYLVFSTRNNATGMAERMRIDSSGNIGIGTSTPASKLTILGADNETGGILLSNSLGSSYGRIYNTNDDLYIQNVRGGSNKIYLGTVGYTQTVALAGGNVGIGTTSPSTKLHIFNNTSGTTPSVTGDTLTIFQNNNATNDMARVAIIGGSGADGYSIVDFGDKDDADVGSIQYDHNNNRFTFRTNATSNQLVINASGSVGINTTSPLDKLHVNGGSIRIQAPNGEGLHINDTTSGDDWYYTGNAGGAHLSYNATATPHIFLSRSNLSVGIGTTSPMSTVGGLDISSGGLSLVIGADNAANTRTALTSKYGKIVAAHYNNSEEPMAMLSSEATASASQINVGGGYSTANAATKINFFTSSTNNDTTGTRRMTIDEAGDVGIGNITNPGAQLHIFGLGNLYLDSSSDSGTPYMLFAQNGTTRSLIQYNTGNLTFTVGAFNPLILYDTGAVTFSGNITAYGGTSIQWNEAYSNYLNKTRGNWKLFYSNGTGVFTELALGTDGTFLRANGASAAPTWDTPAGSGNVSQSGAVTANNFTGYASAGVVKDLGVNNSTFELKVTEGSLTDSVVVSADIKDYTIAAADIANSTLTDLKRAEFNFVFTVDEPDLLSNATGLPTVSRPVWTNTDTRTYTISSVHSTTDVDNYNFSLLKSLNYTNVTAASCTYMQNISVADNGESCFYNNTTSFTNATVEAGKRLIFQSAQNINVTNVHIVIRGNYS